jgi:hypothetical protein
LAPLDLMGWEVEWVPDPGMEKTPTAVVLYSRNSAKPR